MGLFYIETDNGCGIRSGEDKQDVIRQEVSEMIQDWIVRPATEEEIAYIKAMGGYVPEETENE
jgi:hypothetical protein